jgi:enhancing lycopene biosynthesis protein 2
MANVLVVLSGCGVMDGSEIHESVITLLHLDRLDASVTFAAPNVEQFHVVNHLTGQPASGERRQVMVESARIARGKVLDLASVRGDQFDAVIFPGGYGAAKNLCSFASKADACEVHPEVARVLREAHRAGKTIGLICISPVIGARVFKDAKVTIGSDEATAAAIGKMGAQHQRKATTDICIDEVNRIVSTPAYMSARRISEVYEGIGKLVDAVLQMAAKPTRQAVCSR